MKSIFRFAALAGILCAGLYTFEGQTKSPPAKTSDAPTILRMDHVGINVTDLQRSADWYQKALGFTIFHKSETWWMISRGDMHLSLFLRPNAKKIDDLDPPKDTGVVHSIFIYDPDGYHVEIVSYYK